MTIKLILRPEGYLEINASDEVRYSIQEEGVLLAMPFRTIARGDRFIIIDPVGSLSGTVEYILGELKKGGFFVELNPELTHYWNNYQLEGGKIDLLKRRRASKPVTVQNLKNFYKSTRKPFSHQLLGIQHAINTRNAANFSVPGSGKTQTALGIFLHWKKEGIVEKALIIGPASCFEPWETENNECLKEPLSTLRWYGSITKRHRIASKVKEADLILITYQTACNDERLLEQLLRKHKVMLIVDESHYIKNSESVRSKVAIRLSPYASIRLILTGTPAPQSLIDIWTQFSFLWPSKRLLGEFFDFQKDLEKYRNPVSAIGKELKPFFYRTTKKDLKLPEINHKSYFIKESKIPIEQHRIIQMLELKTLKEARNYLSENDLDILRNWRKARIIRLLQAVSNPALLLTRLDIFNIKTIYDIDMTNLMSDVLVFIDKRKIPAKISATIDKAADIVRSGRKVVIWSWFVENILYLNELLKDYNPLMVFGQIKPYSEKEDADVEQTREKNIKEFKHRADRPILLANPAACAESISLHKHCQEAIYLDRNFNCGQLLQSMDRIHRVGMPSGLTATYYMPLINCAIERAVDERLKRKQKVMYGFLNDPMPVLGIEDDAWLSDSDNALDDDFNEVLKQIQNGTK